MKEDDTWKGCKSSFKGLSNVKELYERRERKSTQVNLAELYERKKEKGRYNQDEMEKYVLMKKASKAKAHDDDTDKSNSKDVLERKKWSKIY